MSVCDHQTQGHGPIFVSRPSHCPFFGGCLCFQPITESEQTEGERDGWSGKGETGRTSRDAVGAFSWNRYVVLLRFVLLCSLILQHTPKKRVHAARDCEDGACRVYRTHTIEVFNITADAFNSTQVCARSACQRFKNLALLRCGQLPSHTHTHTHAIALSTAFSFDVSLRTR